ncbi:hypothetical protein ACWD4B_30700, partial [Streptomyces sp. NPDC002536]
MKRMFPDTVTRRAAYAETSGGSNSGASDGCPTDLRAPDGARDREFHRGQQVRIAHHRHPGQAQGDGDPVE